MDTSDILAQLSEVALTVQTALSGCLTTGTADRQAIVALQGIDWLAQIAADLTTLLANASQAMPADQMRDRDAIFRGVKLAEIITRTGGIRVTGKRSETVGTGDIQLF